MTQIFFQKVGVVRVTWPPKLLEVNANSVEMVKATDFKFDAHPLRDNTDMIPNFFSKRGRGQGHMTPKFWGLNANSFKMVKATDFKFDTHLLRDNTYMTPNFFKKGRGQGHVTPNSEGKMPIAPNRL